MNTLEVFIISCVLALPLVGAAIGFGWYLKQASLDKAANRMIRTTRYKADQLGNYEVFYNWKTGESFVLPPGNRAHPDQIILNNGQAKPLENINTRPFVVQVNSGQRSRSDQAEQKKIAESKEPVTGQYKELPPEQEPEQVAPDVEPVLLPEPDQARSVQSIKDELIQAKREGRAKVESILKASCVRSRSSATYKFYSEFWDSL